MGSRWGEDSNTKSYDEAVPSISKPNIGRHPGSTDDKKREDANKLKDCISAIVYDYAAETIS